MQKEVIPSAATAKAATSKTTATATTAAARKTKNEGGEGSKKVGREMGLLRPRSIGQCSPLTAHLCLVTTCHIVYTAKSTNLYKSYRV